MGEIENIKQYAYFREFTHTNQSELLFNIDTKVPSLGVFKEEIKAVRAVADTVSSLLQHIKNKILKIIEDKYMENKVNKEDFSEKFDIPVSLKADSIPIRSNIGLKAFRNILLKDQFVIFKVFDQQYIVLPNPPLIKQIKLPPVLYTSSCIQPYKYSAMFTENQKSLFIWYKSMDKINWVETARGYGYITKDSDVGYYLKVLCKPVSNIGIQGPSAEAVSESTVEKMGDLPWCPFERRHQYTKDKLINDNE